MRFLIIYWIILKYLEAVEAKSVATALVAAILEGYDTRVKPTRDHLKPINVTLRPDLYLLVDVDEPHQSISISIWISEQWEDELLYWTPWRYNNITRVTLPHDSVWVPDTVLYNSIVMEDEEVRRLLNVQIDVVPERRTTIVKFNYPSILTFSCRLNMLYFPFDMQNCTLVFGSWTYDNSGIDYDFASRDVDVGQFVQSAGWDLISFTAERVVSKYPCCPEAWTTINLHLCLKRKPLFYIINLIIPSIIISLISILGLFTPSSSTGERTERVTLGITTLLSLSILLLMVSDQMPTTSAFVPMIGWFFLCKIFLISIGSLLTTMVIKIHQRGLEEKRISETAKYWGMWFSMILRVPIPKHFRMEKQSYSPIPKKMRAKELQPLVLTCRQPPCYLKVVQNGSAQGYAPESEETLDISMYESTYDQQNKHYAAVEWEWLATVCEKASCILCLVFLCLISGVILIMGFFTL